MAQTSELIKTLKQALKAHGKTYATVSRELGLTETSIKRLFWQENFSLERLDRICHLLDMELSDLAQLMNERQRKLQQLTVEQEQEITNDTTLLLVAICALNKSTMIYGISAGERFRKLARLGRLKIIDLLPKNRIKVRVAANFSWRENGPIQAFFQARLSQEVLSGRFSRDDECLIVLNEMLSPESNAEYQRKLKRLAWEFDLLNSDDASLPLQQRGGVTVVMAVRGWQYGVPPAPRSVQLAR